MFYQILISSLFYQEQIKLRAQVVSNLQPKQIFLSYKFNYATYKIVLNNKEHVSLFEQREIMPQKQLGLLIKCCYILYTRKAERRGTNQQQNDLLATDHTKFHHNLTENVNLYYFKSCTLHVYHNTNLYAVIDLYILQVCVC